MLYLSMVWMEMDVVHFHQGEDVSRSSNRVSPSSCRMNIDGLVQDYSNSSAFAMELLQFCTKP